MEKNIRLIKWIRWIREKVGDVDGSGRTIRKHERY